jgi:hypothetical protein
MPILFNSLYGLISNEEQKSDEDNAAQKPKVVDLTKYEAKDALYLLEIILIQVVDKSKVKKDKQHQAAQEQ